MATKIQAIGDTIKIGKTFVSGNDRITVNDEVVFEGKLDADDPETFTVGQRDYSIESRKVGQLTGAISIHLNIHENGELVHTGIYDQNGKSVKSEGQAKANGAIHICSMIGGVVGCTTMLVLNTTTGVVPGGAVGGGIGGGVGAVVGGGIGNLLFGRRK